MAIKTTYDEKAGEFVIRVPFKKGTDPKTLEKSASGKSHLVGTTKGYAAVDGAPDDRFQVSVNMIWNIPKADR